MLLANLACGNIGNETGVFAASQPPILGEHRLKVPQNWGIRRLAVARDLLLDNSSAALELGNLGGDVKTKDPALGAND